MMSPAVPRGSEMLRTSPPPGPPPRRHLAVVIDDDLDEDQDERWWVEHAACRHMGPDIFFPPAGSMGYLDAIAICAGCEVIGPCGDYALSHHIVSGVWGGMSERQRRRLHSGRRAERGT